MRDLLQTSFYFSLYTSFADRLLKPVKGYFAPIRKSISITNQRYAVSMGYQKATQLFNLLIFPISDATEIRRNQKLTGRISSMMFMRKNIGFHRIMRL